MLINKFNKTTGTNINKHNKFYFGYYKIQLKIKF